MHFSLIVSVHFVSSLVDVFMCCHVNIICACLFREHCLVEYDGETVMFYPKANLCSIDGVVVSEPTKLPQGMCRSCIFRTHNILNFTCCISCIEFFKNILGCMVCLGKSNYFRFNHPKEAKRIRENNPGNRFSIMPDKYYPGK